MFSLLVLWLIVSCFFGCHCNNINDPEELYFPWGIHAAYGTIPQSTLTFMWSTRLPVEASIVTLNGICVYVCMFILCVCMRVYLSLPLPLASIRCLRYCRFCPISFCLFLIVCHNPTFVFPPFPAANGFSVQYTGNTTYFNDAGNDQVISVYLSMGCICSVT